MTAWGPKPEGHPKTGQGCSKKNAVYRVAIMEDFYGYQSQSQRNVR
jgi:hypothetical protein